MKSTVRVRLLAALFVVGCGPDVAADGGDASEDVDANWCGTDGWEAVAPMLEVRHAHAAVRLADGRVLVTGGLGPGPALASAELWDPATDSWSVVADMPIARRRHGLVLVDDGSVLAIGGGDPSTQVDRWDPATDTWTEAGALPSGLDSVEAHAAPDGGVLVVGSNAIFSSDDRGESWTTVEPPPRATFGMHVSRWGADRFVFGVHRGFDDPLQPIAHPVVVFDWSTRTWSDLPGLDTSNRDVYGGYVNAWGPLSDDELLVVTNLQYHGADVPPPSSVAFEIGDPELEDGWGSGVGGPWFGGDLALVGAVAFEAGALWVGADAWGDWIYRDADDSWCRAAELAERPGEATRTLLPEGRILFTGGRTREDDGYAASASAHLWSP